MYPAGHPTAAAGGVGGSDPSKANIQVPVLSPQEVPTPARSEVESISLASRVSEFWPDQPRVWFVRTEAILGPQKLSDEARFDLVVQKLGKDVVNHVTDILINPPPTKKFDTLKQRLLAIYEESHNRHRDQRVRAGRSEAVPATTAHARKGDEQVPGRNPQRDLAEPSAQTGARSPRSFSGDRPRGPGSRR